MRLDRAEGDPAPVPRAEHGLLDGDRLAQTVAENPEAPHADLVEALQHLAGQVAGSDGLLEGVAVDQHRRLQRLEAGDAHRVEDPCSRPAQVGLARGHRPHHLLLGIVGEAAHSLTTSIRTLPPERSFTCDTNCSITGALCRSP